MTSLHSWQQRSTVPFHCWEGGCIPDTTCLQDPSQKGLAPFISFRSLFFTILKKSYCFYSLLYLLSISWQLWSCELVRRNYHTACKGATPLQNPYLNINLWVWNQQERVDSKLWNSHWTSEDKQSFGRPKDLLFRVN